MAGKKIGYKNKYNGNKKTKNKNNSALQIESWGIVLDLLPLPKEKRGSLPGPTQNLFRLAAFHPVSHICSVFQVTRHFPRFSIAFADVHSSPIGAAILPDFPMGINLFWNTLPRFLWSARCIFNSQTRNTGSIRGLYQARSPPLALLPLYPPKRENRLWRA